MPPAPRRRPIATRRRTPDTTTESYIALKVNIANWRWNGTPFYLRTGKRMKDRVTEIVVRFKEPPHSIFDEDAGRNANELAIRLQPERGHGPARDDQGAGPRWDAG